MCSYSMIADHGKDMMRSWPTYDTGQALRMAELERRIADLEVLLAKAKKYDADNGEPDCELDSKKKALRDLAKHLGVEINLP